MLLNFCNPRLRPEITCDAISTEGYEVSNLISESRKGFLAYSCIRPPVHIDVTFLCNIVINRIIIWPVVGSQKSSGFQLYSKVTNSNIVPYKLLSTGFLSPSDAGLLFYSADVDLRQISVPGNFLKCSIRSCRQLLTIGTQSIRLTICKTEKSVPALGRIEVWGVVSPRCGKDVAASVHSLLSEVPRVASSLALPECNIDKPGSATQVKQEAQVTSDLEIPECFLDAITWELMTQPVTLPSGNVIDQTTLEKHGQNEAIWGRPFSDPFTGMPFSDHRRPIMASALKYRIDKFLLENSERKEIKNIPRVLGHNSVRAGDRRIIEIPKCVQTTLKRTAEVAKVDARTTTDGSSKILQQPKKHCHQLPVTVITRPTQFTARTRARLRQVRKVPESFQPLSDKSSNDDKNDDVKILAADNSLTDNPLNSSEIFLLSKMKRFNAPEKVELHNISSSCECCDNKISYRLPCKHVICRKVLLSIGDNRCSSCGLSYKLNEIERVHGDILSR